MSGESGLPETTMAAPSDRVTAGRGNSVARDRGPNLQAVADTIRGVTAETVLPRFRDLAESDVREKKPGDLVTIADEETEDRLRSALEALWPGSHAIGEELVAAGGASREDVYGEGRFWCIDPIDGTAAFAAGNPRFSVLVSAFEDGETLGAWAYQPVGDRFAMAAAGGPVRFEGAPPARLRAERLEDAYVLATRGGFQHRKGKGYRALALHCAGLTMSIGCGVDFLDLIDGTADLVLFSTIAPWEYPCGVLLLQAAGCSLSDLSGQPLTNRRETHDLFMAASSEAVLTSARAVLAQETL